MPPKSQVDIGDLEADSDKEKDTTTKKRASSRSSSTSSRTENDLRSRLVACLERVSESMHERGDEELAGILSEDARIMAQGLVSLTRPFKALRTPLLAVVAIIEPALAFGRIFRVLVLRWSDRRQRIAAERELQAEHEQQQ